MSTLSSQCPADNLDSLFFFCFRAVPLARRSAEVATKRAADAALAIKGPIDATHFDKIGAAV